MGLQMSMLLDRVMSHEFDPSGLCFHAIVYKAHYCEDWCSSHRDKVVYQHIQLQFEALEVDTTIDMLKLHHRGSYVDSQNMV